MLPALERDRLHRRLAGLWSIPRGIPPIDCRRRPRPGPPCRWHATVSLWFNLCGQLVRIFPGFAASTLFGVSLGVMMGTSRAHRPDRRSVDRSALPAAEISLIPLMIIGSEPARPTTSPMSAISAFFPIVISTFAGVQQVDKGLVRDRARPRRQCAAGSDQGGPAGGGAAYLQRPASGHGSSHHPRRRRGDDRRLRYRPGRVTCSSMPDRSGHRQEASRASSSWPWSAPSSSSCSAISTARRRPGLRRRTAATLTAKDQDIMSIRP